MIARDVSLGRSRQTCASASLLLLMYVFDTSHYRQLLDGDEVFCRSFAMPVRAFCEEDLPRRRQAIRRASIDAKNDFCRDRFRVTRRAQTSDVLRHSVLQHKDYLPGMPAWSTLTPHGSEKDLRMRVPPPNHAHAPMSMGDVLGAFSNISVRTCHVYDPTGDSWTFEQSGPHVGRGAYEWHSAGWPDAGQFFATSHLPVWITAFGFAPIDEHRVVGWPPLHIHHMHISQSQSLLRFFGSGGTLPMFSAPYDGFQIEGDIHGDRQCQSSRGGTDCLIRAYPEGFGIQITRPLHTFYDINDVREAPAAPLEFWTEHSYRWTRRHDMRPVLRFMSDTPSNIPIASMRTNAPRTASGVPYPWHDDYLLTFDPKSSFVVWSTNTFQKSGTHVRFFWHVHHKATQNVWLVDADASHAGLKGIPNMSVLPTPWHGYVRLAYKDLSNTMRAVERNMHPSGRIRCTLNDDRWDVVGVDSRIERFHSPRCQPWNVAKGQNYTVISWHASAEVIGDAWMHTVLYSMFLPRS